MIIEDSATQLIVIESDVKILDASTIDDGKITFPASLMPDGVSFVGIMPATGLDNELLMQWCSSVRSQYHARIESQTATEGVSTTTAGASREGQATPTEGPSRVQDTAAKFIPGNEMPLEEVLKDRVAGKAHRQAAIDVELGDLQVRVSMLQDEELAIAQEVKMIVSMLNQLDGDE